MMAIVWDILPMTYIIYSNYLVYRRIPKSTTPSMRSPMSPRADDKSKSENQWYKETYMDLMRDE